MIMHGIIVSLSILLVRHDIPYYSYGVGFCNLLVLLEGQVLRPGSWDEQVRSPTSFLYMHRDRTHSFCLKGGQAKKFC